jgi:predicted transcriptional regulator
VPITSSTTIQIIWPHPIGQRSGTIRLELVPGFGYTPGMKTAISVPDDVFERAERLARRERRSRSEVYSAAIREYVARHEPDEVTATLDEVIGEIEPRLDPFVRAAGSRVIERSQW